MKKKLLFCTMAAFMLAANVCAQNWKMVVAHSDGTFDTIAVEKVKDVTFFKTSTQPVTPKDLGIEFVKIPAGSFLMEVRTMNLNANQEKYSTRLQ